VIKDFTGISAPYEPPLKPEIELRTDQITVAECVTLVVEYLKAERIQPPEDGSSLQYFWAGADI